MAKSSTDALERKVSKLERRIGKLEEILSYYQVPDTEPTEEEESPLKRVTDHYAFSVNWLGLVAIVCFVVAAGFIIKLSMEYGWLTTERKLAASAALGFALIASGFLLSYQTKAKSYASLLPAAGIIVLYLTTFATHNFYKLIDLPLALGLTVGVSAICIVLYRVFHHEIYALAAAVGTYLAPMILGLNMSYSTPYLAAYSLTASVAYMTISLWFKTRLLSITSAYLALIACTPLVLNQAPESITAQTLALHFLIFAIGTYAWSKINNQPLTQTEAWSTIPVLLLFYTLEYATIERMAPGWAPIFAICFGTSLIGIYHLAKSTLKKTLGSGEPLISFLSLISVHAIYLDLIPTHAQPITLPVILLVAATALHHSKPDWSQRFMSRSYLIPTILIATVLGREYFLLVHHLTDHSSSSNLANLPVAAASVLCFWAIIYNLPRKQPTEVTYAILAITHILAVITLYNLAYRYDMGSLAVSAMWLGYSALILLLAFTRKDTWMAKSAVIVLILAAGKALLYDASSAPTLIRVACLLLTGGVLYGAGYFMRQANNWPKHK